MIHTAMADLQGLCRFADLQFVLTVDHRFVLGKPALQSAPSQKIILKRQLADLRV